MTAETESRKLNRFFLGLAFIWVPFVLGSVALGGLSTTGPSRMTVALTHIFFSLPWLSCGISLALEIYGLVLLGKGLARNQYLRTVVSLISMCASALMIFVFGMALLASVLALIHIAPGLA